MNSTECYNENKKTKVGNIIVCPICHKSFKKNQYSQAFCGTKCKDKYHNRHEGDRHKDINYYYKYNRYNNRINDSVWGDYESGDEDQWGDMELGIHD